MSATPQTRRTSAPHYHRIATSNVPTGSQTGRAFIVAGGSSGLGLELCRVLAPSGATVYMAARSQTRAESAIRENEPHNVHRPPLKFLQLDLADLISVRAAAETFTRKESRLDVLWNNAGIGGDALGTESTPPPRVVWLGSGIIDMGAPVNGVDSEQLETGIEDRAVNLCVTANPGNLNTGAFDNTPSYIMFFLKLFGTIHKPVLGAYTELYAGLSSELKIEHNGTYVLPFGRRRPDGEITCKDILKAMAPVEEGGLGNAKRSWEWCESKYQY
ncbi:NAD(P)-binding protein [Xylariaceae sp. FL0255]|nr:NAD(P)-binding protein [Xylariaceae sp. FL0255]